MYETLELIETPEFIETPQLIETQELILRVYQDSVDDRDSKVDRGPVFDWNPGVQTPELLETSEFMSCDVTWYVYADVIF